MAQSQTAFVFVIGATTRRVSIPLTCSWEPIGTTRKIVFARGEIMLDVAGHLATAKSIDVAKPIHTQN